MNKSSTLDNMYEIMLSVQMLAAKAAATIKNDPECYPCFDGIADHILACAKSASYILSEYYNDKISADHTEYNTNWLEKEINHAKGNS